ncbi:hypothetical protein Pelo_5607 [Pelomyxa schiedti]|nr:hypothetical protein Pelo_5607 [Pelomyxa schiedti]
MDTPKANSGQTMKNETQRGGTTTTRKQPKDRNIPHFHYIGVLPMLFAVFAGVAVVVCVRSDTWLARGFSGACAFFGLLCDFGAYVTAADDAMAAARGGRDAKHTMQDILENGTFVLWLHPGLLHAAAAAGNTEAVVVLALAGAGMNRRAGPEGRTALHAAVAAGRWDSARALLAMGASPWVENNAGVTPMEMAPEDRRQWMAEAKFLLKITVGGEYNSSSINLMMLYK